MKVRYLRGARRNIDDISLYVRQHNPAAALRIGERIRSVVALMAEHPAMGAPGRVQATREFKIPDLPYVIIYRVTQHTSAVPVLEILRVHHGRRQPLPPDWDTKE